MKRVILFCITIILLSSNILFAKTYDISQIANCKLVTEYSENTTVDQMDTVTFGSYPQSDASGNTKEPIEWIVLDRQGNKYFLLSKYILDCKSYNDIYQDITWENCTLRIWLNSTFLNKAFTGSEQEYIDTTNVINSNSEKYGTYGGNNTNDKIFCLSINEIKEYFYQNNWKRPLTCGTNYAKVVNDSDFKLAVRYEIDDTKYNGNSWFWLRSPGRKMYDVALVNDVGGIHEGGFIVDSKGNGVRPALWVNVSSTTSHKNVISRNAGSSNSSTRNENTVKGLPAFQSELRNDNHYYFNNAMQKNVWVFDGKDYYHVDGKGNIEKNKWIDQRYVGSDGKLYRGRQTPDGKYVGDDGRVVNIVQDLVASMQVETVQPDSWYKTQSGLWYYFENDRTTTKKGWFHDKRDNQWYYLDLNTGIMQVGWVNVGGKDYYFNESHSNANNWYETGDGFFESYGKKVKAYGSMFKSEKTPDGYWVNYKGEYVKNGNFITVMDPKILIGTVLGLVILLVLITKIKRNKKNNIN